MLSRHHAIPIAVATAYLGLAAAGGGYSAELRAAATIVVWWFVSVGLASGALPRARVPGRALLAGGGLLALAALSLLSMAWAPDDGAAFHETVRALGYLGVFTLVVVAAAPGGARRWLAGLALGLVALGTLALASRMQPSLFPEQDLVRLIPSVRTRLSYPLNYWNGLAACMAPALVLLVWLGAHAATRAARALAVAALPLPGLALFLTSSRGGMVAAAVGLATLLAAGPARARIVAGGIAGGAATACAIAFANARESFVDGAVNAADAGSHGREMLVLTLLCCVVAGVVRWAGDGALARVSVPRGASAAAAGVLTVALAVAVVVSDPAERLDRFNDPPAAPGEARGFVTRHLASAEGSGRYQFWSAGLDAFAAHPVRGIGAGGYESWWAQHGSLRYFIRDAHSLFVEILAELGLLGLLALACFVGASAAGWLAARTATRTGDPRAGPASTAALAVLACGLASAAIDWTWELPAAFVPLVVAAGILAGPALAASDAALRPRFGLGLGTLAVAWLAVVAATIVLVSEAKLADSRDAVRRGDLAGAANDARAAQAVEPWSGVPRLQLALVRERAGDLAGARQAVDQAIERDREDWRVWLVATRLATKAGDVAEARRALRRARSLNPRAPLLAGDSP